ncbi:hypothetical protein HM1_1976 [Heliomicrobium modesticaldum Ice1]|uniref:Uncharacterized protein n=1 Tax=Heliobacterium modesticaldum (strain ATCC 51547 / Ice1) TaxID=498761 RepID=B0TFV4_HELMI|nr:hypothetical protein HM1_1976 [Heliomicrobium modesticaldum Ice1]
MKSRSPHLLRLLAQRGACPALPGKTEAPDCCRFIVFPYNDSMRCDEKTSTADDRP